MENARFNAAQNGVSSAEYLCGDAGETAARLAARGVRPDAVIVDPPRRGVSAELIDAVCAMAPERLIYVSCDPATLARDLRLLAGRGYAAVRCRAVDMFPRTSHVETVVLLTKAHT